MDFLNRLHSFEFNFPNINLIVKIKGTNVTLKKDSFFKKLPTEFKNTTSDGITINGTQNEFTITNNNNLNISVKNNKSNTEVYSCDNCVLLRHKIHNVMYTRDFKKVIMSGDENNQTNVLSGWSTEVTLEKENPMYGYFDGRFLLKIKYKYNKEFHRNDKIISVYGYATPSTPLRQYKNDTKEKLIGVIFDALSYSPIYIKTNTDYDRWFRFESDFFGCKQISNTVIEIYTLNNLWLTMSSETCQPMESKVDSESQLLLYLIGYELAFNKTYFVDLTSSDKLEMSIAVDNMNHNSFKLFKNKYHRFIKSLNIDVKQTGESAPNAPLEIENEEGK